MITTLFHPNLKRFMFVDQLNSDSIDSIIVDALGNTISRDILENTTIKTYLEIKKRQGWNIEHANGMTFLKHDSIHELNQGKKRSRFY